MAKRIAIANYKGGTGKSTVTLLLAEGLALYHKARVLAVDLDPLAVLSNVMMSVEGVQAATGEKRTLWEMLRQLAGGHDLHLSRYICTKVSDLIELRDAKDSRRIDLIPSSPPLLKQLAEIESKIRAKHPRESVDLFLARVIAVELDRIDKSYDFVLFDCPAGPVPQTGAALRLSSMTIAPTVLENNSITALNNTSVMSRTRARVCATCPVTFCPSC